MFFVVLFCLAIWSYSHASKLRSERAFERNLIFLRHALTFYELDNGITSSKSYETAGLLIVNDSFVEKYVSPLFKGRSVPVQLYEGRTSPPKDPTKPFPVLWNKEPYHNKKFVLLSTGQIVRMTPSEFDKTIKAEVQ